MMLAITDDCGMDWVFRIAAWFPAPVPARFDMNPETPDTELFQQIAQGDERAFAALYDRFSAPLFSLAYKILNDEKESEEVLQDVFLKLWDMPREFDAARGKPFSWMATLTRNRSIDRLRARQTRQRITETATPELAENLNAGGDASDEFWREEKAAAIRSTLQNLPEEQRQALEMVYFGGMTHQEVSEKTREPLGTVKARIRRAMLKLRDALEGRL